ncbi:unnamed protein product [Ilex paraguariensis]|uniref:OCRE domain-containing protein n=1 Tax=Ilex paraguariensis TaxID=185542 RepID=A0ABC8QXT1_9AQUA
MAGTNEPDAEESHKNECSFEWDEESHLYYHASTGFYHDPGAGWYYSIRDGVYYKYEDGNYVPLGSDQDVQSDTNGYGGIVLDNSVQDESCIRVLCQEDVDDSSLHAAETDACKVGEPSTGEPG